MPSCSLPRVALAIATVAVSVVAAVAVSPVAPAIPGRSATQGTPDAPVAAAGSLARVAALAGTWRVADSPTMIEEVWTSPAGGNMTGLFRMLGPDGAPRVLELLMLTATEKDGLELRFRHFDAELQPWEAERDAPLILREVPAAADDFAPARVRFRSVRDDAEIGELVYDLRTPGHLHVMVDFAGPDRADFELHFTRLTRPDAARP